MSALLSIQGMSHYFGGLKAVSNFTFDVPEGVIYGLIGPNGSGKTTTFNLITGIYTPTEGKILFEGREITGQKPFRIQNGQIKDALPTATRNRGAADMLNLQHGFHALYGVTEQVHNLDDLWLVSPKLSRL